MKTNTYAIWLHLGNSMSQVHLFDVKMDLASFKTCLRDFLVKLKEFSGEEDEDGDTDLADL